MTAHDEYLARCTPDTRQRLEAIRAEGERRIGGTERCIAYQMPALRKGKVFFYFAAFKHHVGIYPPVDGPAELIQELAPYRGSKGNLSFPHNQPLPLDLIGRVAEALAARYATA